MDTKSRLMTLDIWLKLTLEDAHLVRLEQFIRGEFTVLKEMDHQYTPEGLTLVYILSESHCIIHTYPEHNFLSLDLFICNPSIDLNSVKQTLIALLPVQKFESRVLERG